MSCPRPAAAIAAGLDPLEGWGRVAKALTDCSGEVPTILVVDGPAVAGPAGLLGLADLVVMTAASYAFVNGPVMVSEFTGVEISTVELGGPVHLARHTGVHCLVVEDREAAVATVERTARLLAVECRPRTGSLGGVQIPSTDAARRSAR